MKARKIIPILLSSILMLSACDNKGQKGDVGPSGVSIVSITLTSSDANVDTYTISYSDGTTSTFTVTNGVNGEQGIQGEKGEDGHSPVITIGQDGHWYIDGVDTGITAQGPKGDTGEQGIQGEQGVSIESITLTGTVDNVDVYTITYSNGETSIFTVTNGVNGEQGIQGEKGEDGHSPVITIGQDGHWYVDGVDTGIAAQGPKGDTGEQGPKGDTGEQGPKGEDGRSIESIALSSSTGNIDIYTITYSDGNTSTFTVTNGVNGEQGIQGEKGEDGHSPVITIGQDGHWYVDGVDTGIAAQGPKGDTGEQGPKGDTGEQGPKGEDGLNGKDGTSMRTGSGEPDNEIGIDGDSYINLDNWDYYVKVNEVWVLMGNIKGESAEDENPQGLAFYLQDDGTYGVGKGYADYLSNIVIPSHYKGKLVTGIIRCGFEDHRGEVELEPTLKSITLPETIKTIGDSAFSGCGNLENINLSEGLERIEGWAFSGCWNLKLVKLPSTLKKIESGVFEELDIKVIIPSELEEIAEGNSSIHAYYMGSVEQWNSIPGSSDVSDVYYYSESEPVDTDYTYWHYVDEKPVIWQI